MLTLKQLVESYRRQYSLPTRTKYRLEFWPTNNRDGSIGPIAEHFNAPNVGLGMIRAMRVLKIKGRLTTWKFNKAGGKVLFFNGKKIFPQTKRGKR